jgi:hypothetical protein
MHTRRYRAETLVREGQIWATPWERSRVRRPGGRGAGDGSGKGEWKKSREKKKDERKW